MESSGATNPFEAEWRACLEAHLQHVLVTGDKSNEVTLLEVLKIAGFTEGEISRLRRATLGLTEEEVELGELVSVEVAGDANPPEVPEPEPIGSPLPADVPALPDEATYDEAVYAEDVTTISTLDVLSEPVAEADVAVEADAATTVHMEVDAPEEPEASPLRQQPPPQQLSLF